MCLRFLALKELFIDKKCLYSTRLKEYTYILNIVIEAVFQKQGDKGPSLFPRGPFC